MKKPEEQLTRPATPAIPPPPKENENISNQVGKLFIAALEERLSVRTMSVSEIVESLPKLKELNGCENLESVGTGRVGLELYDVCDQFGINKITPDCLKAAIEVMELHFCTKQQTLEFPEKKNSVHLTLSLKRLLRHSMQEALLHQVISYNNLMDELRDISSYTDLEEAAFNCALMEELFVICGDFMDEYNDMKAINIALAGLTLTAFSLQPME